MNERFRGIFSAALTAFDGRGDFCEAAQRAMLRAELVAGIKGFYVGGSTGEAFLLSPEERRELYRVCAEEVGGKATLIAHVGAISQREAVSYAKTCAALGYDALSSVTPFYYKFSADEIVGYYQALADATDLPLIIYYIPVLTGAGQGFELFDRLLTDPRILGVKYTSSDYFLFERLRARYPDKILYNGFDETCLCGLAMGADGAIGSTYNVIGPHFLRLERLCRENDLAAARAAQHEANAIIGFLLQAGDVKAAVKYAFRQKYGIDVGCCRAPGGDVPEAWKTEYPKFAAMIADDPQQ